MKRIKRIFKNIDIHDFKHYTFFSILLIVTLIAFSTFQLTQARYESNLAMNVQPNLAFLIVGVESKTGQIKLEGMVPRDEPYEYEFNVSNFSATEHANVDLTYSIEIITTTNMKLDFKIFKGNDVITDQVDSDSITQDENDVYYRHLVINDVSTMNYASNCTDKYTLWVSYPTGAGTPSGNMYNPDTKAGVIDLVDIKISAEQVV